MTQIQQLMQKLQHQPALNDKWVMLPWQHFDGSNPSTVVNHLTTFEKYVAFETRQSSINTVDELKNIITLM